MKNYTITLVALTPVHIGNGNTILKKDFELMGSYANIYDPLKLHSILSERYESFLMNTRESLTDFIKNTNTKKINDAIKYKVFCGNSGIRKTDNVAEFIKDPYGLPYIPGSSIKGAIRTAILSGIVRQKPGKKDGYTEFRNSKGGDGAKAIEEKAFGSIIENKFRHIKISDSEPLLADNLILCKKIDVFKNGNERTLNICRESLAPGTKIQFKLTIDEADDGNWNTPWTAKQIIGSIENFARYYRKDFLDKFPSTDDEYGESIIYLGGGTGFVTKTIDYSLYGDNAVKKISEYLAMKFGSRKNPDMHNHIKDIGLGVSPRMKKCTKVKGRLVEMGICRIRIEENETI